MASKREERRRKQKEEEEQFERERLERAQERKKKRAERQKALAEEEARWEAERAARRVAREKRKKERENESDAEAAARRERRKAKGKFKGTIIGGRGGTRIGGTRIKNRSRGTSPNQSETSTPDATPSPANKSRIKIRGTVRPESPTNTVLALLAATAVVKSPASDPSPEPSPVKLEVPTTSASSKESVAKPAPSADPKVEKEPSAKSRGEEASLAISPTQEDRSIDASTKQIKQEAAAVSSREPSPRKLEAPATVVEESDDSFFECDTSSEESSSEYETSETEDYEDAMEEYEGFVIEDWTSIEGFLTNETADAVDLDVAADLNNLQFDDRKMRYQFDNIKYSGNENLQLITCKYEDRKTFRKLMIVSAEGHDNLRKVYGFGEGDIHFLGTDDRDWTEENFPFVVVDPVGESLEHFLKKDQFLNLREVVEGMLGLAMGLEFVHAYGLAVGDLHVGKIEVRARGVLVISELLYFWCPKDELPWGGTPLFQSPEIIEVRLKGMKDVPVDQSSDVFSLGYVMWQMIHKYKAKKYAEPDAGMNSQAFLTKLIDKNYRPKFPPGTNSSLRKLIRRCWDKKPAQRPPASEVVKTLQTMLVNMGSAVDEVKFGEEGHKFITEPRSVGANINDFFVTQADMKRKTLKAFKNSQKVVYIAPSVSMKEVAQAVAELDEYATDVADASEKTPKKKRKATSVLVITQDLPFTLRSFREDACLSGNLHLLSAWGSTVIKDFQLELQGPIPGIAACAVYVLSKEDVVTFAQILPVLPGKPNLSVVKSFIEGDKKKKKKKKKNDAVEHEV